MSNTYLKLCLQEKLGGFGMFLYIVMQILALFSLFVPLAFFELTFWGYVIFAGILCLPLWGTLFEIYLYCATFSTAAADPTFWKIAYFISLVIFLLTSVIPTIIDIIVAIIDRSSSH